jgi:hypothetical protein
MNIFYIIGVVVVVIIVASFLGLHVGIADQACRRDCDRSLSGTTISNQWARFQAEQVAPW